MSAAIADLKRLADALADERTSLGTLASLRLERIETELRATAEELRGDWDGHTALLEEANGRIEVLEETREAA